MNSHESQLQQASACFNAGKLAEAKALCTEILHTDPNAVEVLHLSGIISAQVKNFWEAADLVAHAIDLAPGNPMYYSSLGNIFLALNRYADALEFYDKAIHLKADYAQAYANRGNALSAMGQMSLALESYEKSVELMPTHAQGHYNRATVLSHFQRWPEALACFHTALSLQPTLVSALVEKGIALHRLGQLDVATQCYQTALLHAPHHVQALFNLGLALDRNGQTQAAVSSFERVITLEPGHVDAQVSLGNALLELHQVEAALGCYNRALHINPDMAEAHWNKALALLMQGQWREGWLRYEWRWKKPEFMESSLGAKIPLWHAQAQRPNNLFIWAEQGVGDEIMFGALLSQSLQLADKVTVHMDGRLVPLFSRSMPGIEFHPKHHLVEPSAFGARLPMGSLARVFCNSTAAFEAIQAPFLKADPLRSQCIRASILWAPSVSRPLVCGISWISVNALTGLERTIALETLASALNVEGVQFVSLQYGDTEKEVADVRQKLNVDVLRLDSVDNFNDLDGLAALIDACDLVITIDNSTAHLAGALGKPTWVLLPYAANWRWGLEGSQSPWYPSVKLHRQASPGEWGPVFTQVRDALRGCVVQK